MKITATFVLSTLGLLLLASAAPSQERDRPRNQEADRTRQAALTPKDAGADYDFQGEYSGEYETDRGRQRLGVQVIALGDGRFRAVAHTGGLPGDGWNGEDKVEVEGRLENGAVTFTAENGQGVIRDDVLSIQRLDGSELGQLKKVHRKSPTLGKKPPEGAAVLFDGTSAENFPGARMTDGGLLTQGATSRQTFQDGTLHLEFQLSFMPHARGQARSNSGVYVQGRYEVQILDSFGLEGRHNECGGIYAIADPKVNMCFPPLAWQTYDIDFTAARYENGQKVAPARMTVRHNGVVIHDNVEVPRATRAAPKAEGPEPGPVYLQDHGNPLRFRNIWVAEK